MSKKTRLKVIPWVLGIVVVAALALVPACAPGAPEEGPTMTLSIAAPWPKAMFMCKGAVIFTEVITERTDGRITFEEYYGGTLCKPDELLDTVSTGRADMVVGAPLYAPGRLPLSNWPIFLFNDPDPQTQDKIRREIHERVPELNDELAQYDVAPCLQFFTIRSYDFMSTVPIQTFEDFEGLRSITTPVEWRPVLEAAGTVPTFTPAPQWYEMLEYGTVDVLTTSPEMLYTFKINEVCPYYLKAKLQTPPTLLFLWINLDAWNSLTSEDRQLFIDVGKESETLLYDYLYSEVYPVIDATFEEAGVTYYTLSEEDKEKWAESVADAPALWAEEMEAEGLPGWEIVDLYMQLSKEYGWEFPREWGQR